MSAYESICMVQKVVKRKCQAVLSYNVRHDRAEPEELDRTAREVWDAVGRQAAATLWESLGDA